MEQQTENNSTTILLVICVAVVVIVAGGWFLLDGGSSSTAEEPLFERPGPAEPTTDEAPAGSAESAPEVVAEEQPNSQPVANEQQPVDAQIEIDANLRKARLAAEAEVILDPPGQSALYFYGLVLTQDPNNEVANAELSALLGQLNVSTSASLAAQDWEEAYRVATRVAQVRPDHTLVNEVQQTLDQYSGSLVTQAMQAAESGDRGPALEYLSEAQDLPGRNPDYFSAVAETVENLLSTREQAEIQRVASEQQAAAVATSSWMDDVRSAISAGRLIGANDTSAMSIFGERTDDDEITSQLRQELFGAILASATTAIDAGELESGEAYLDAASTVASDREEVTSLRETLESEWLVRASETVLSVNELDRISMVPARYPRRAEERGVSGWVELLFTVTEEGDTTDITVSNADPRGVFDSSAIRAVEQWKFTPRQFRGRTIAQRATTRLVFELNESQ